MKVTENGTIRPEIFRHDENQQAPCQAKPEVASPKFRITPISETPNAVVAFYIDPDSRTPGARRNDREKSDQVITRVYITQRYMQGVIITLE